MREASSVAYVLLAAEKDRSNNGDMESCSCQQKPWRPNRAAPETKDFLTTKTRVANHTLFPSTA